MWLDLAGSSRRTSTPRRGRLDERVDEALVGDEVGVRHPDVALGPVDPLDVHRPDREHPQPRHVAVHPDARLPVEAVVISIGGSLRRNLLSRCRFQKSAKLRARSQHAGAGDAAVGVAPLGGVRRADVVAADEADGVVDDEDLAVVAAVAPQVEEPPARRVDGVGEHLHVRREVLERRAYDDVGELVVDDPHLDAPVGRVDDRLLEPLADRVALPDVGLEQDLLLGPLDGGEHVVVQVLAEGVRRDGAVADLGLLGRARRERLGLLAATTVGVDQAHPDRHHQRDPEDHEQRPLDHHRHRVGVVDQRMPGRHAAIQPEAGARPTVVTEL